MIEWLIKIIVKRELNKISASSEAQFFDILCNTYNDGQLFKKIKQ